jgi:arsenate reductase (thioredoxin)
MRQKVLFLCTGNSARSQMAEAFLRTYGADRFDSYSAGLFAKGINPLTIKVMQEIGIDISQQSSKNVQTYLGKIRFEYVIPVCHEAEQQCPKLFPGALHVVQWAFDDPAACEGTEAECLQRFREIRDQIASRIHLWLER